MAQVKYGGGIVQISGSIAGSVFARNRFGNYIRPRTKPVNPNSSGQVGVRSALSYLSTYWHATLTAAQRVAWATYAASVAMKNRLGESIYLTGFNHFIRSNTELVNRSLTLVADGPTVLALPEKDPSFAVSGSAATQLISVAFDDTLDWLDEDDAYMLVYQGVPQIATRNFFGGPWRYMDNIPGDAVTPPTTPTTMTAPFTLVEGQKVWCYARIIRADGRVTEPFYANFTVAA